MKKQLFIGAFLLTSQFSYGAKWNKNNNPNFFKAITLSDLKYTFSSLPQMGQLKDHRLGWSENFWPSNLGGIAYRWNHPNPTPFKYKFYTKEEVKLLTEKELSELSPAELYDLSQSDYSYSLTKKVLKTYTPKDLWWEGICHGWALAASNYPEPDKTVVVNKEGIAIAFGSSDVKGLLAMHDAHNSKGAYARIGDRCKVNGKVNGEAFPEDGDVKMPSAQDAAKEECEDVNAGAFHVVLANMIGIYSRGFVADVDRFNDVWNQPVTGYDSKIVQEIVVTPRDVAEGISRKIRVKTEMFYGDELEFYTPELASKGVLGFVSKEPVTGTNAQVTSIRNYDYILELDNKNRVVGGSWISDSRPDMIWTKAKDAQFMDGKFSLRGLNQIYRPVKP